MKQCYTKDSTPSPSLRRRRAQRWLNIFAVTSVAAVVLFASAAPASIEEQRARLPPPAHCQDPVEGEWRGKKYEPQYGNWFAVTLDVHRTAPSATTLTGRIIARLWYATAQDVEPPPCSPRIRRDYTVEMPASGSITAQRIVFGARTYRLVALHCGTHEGYNPDNFSGVIDPSIQEFQSVNNDGGRAVNDPMVFRRVRCFDPGAAANNQRQISAVIITPPLLPPSRSRGCAGP
jgi:hypothetical protein